MRQSVLRDLAFGECVYMLRNAALCSFSPPVAHRSAINGNGHHQILDLCWASPCLLGPPKKDSEICMILCAERDLKMGCCCKKIELTQ